MRYIAIFLVLELFFPGRGWAADLTQGNYDRGQKVSTLCVQCHGASGRPDVAGMPNLAGQQADYLIQQLNRMREDTWRHAGVAEPDRDGARQITGIKRRNVHMDDVLIRLSDMDIIDIAIYYSAQDCAVRGRAPIAPPSETVRCAVCHGRNGVSSNTRIPNLAGQDRAYLVRQLMAFRNAHEGVPTEGLTSRTARTMQSQVKLLSDADISTVATYYSALSCSPK